MSQHPTANAIRMNHFKLIQIFRGRDERLVNGKPTLELYNLHKDKKELKNVAKQNPKIKYEMLRALMSFEKSFPEKQARVDKRCTRTRTRVRTKWNALYKRPSCHCYDVDACPPPSPFYRSRDDSSTNNSTDDGDQDDDTAEAGALGRSGSNRNRSHLLPQTLQKVTAKESLDPISLNLLRINDEASDEEEEKKA